MLDDLEPLLWTALVLVVLYAAQTVRRWRWMRFEQFAQFPQPGKPSFVWGHMKLLHELSQKGDPRRHIDQVFREVSQEQGNLPVILFDLRPAEYPMLVICNHEIAEQISKPSLRWSSSTPKSPTLVDIQALIGTHSIISDEGEHWKFQRKRLSPGFAPQHLLTLLPIMVDKVQFFIDHLDRLAGNGETFSLDELATNLTFDIIGAITMGRDFKAQVPGQQDELVLTFVAVSQMFKGQMSPGIPLLNWRRNRDRRRLSDKIERLMKDVVRGEHARVTAAGKDGSRSVLALSFQGAEELTPELLQQTSDNLRAFMFAGHDTTSILMQWILYELSRAPRQREALFTELDGLFGTDVDPKVVRSRLLAPGGPELLNQMPYTSAIIKEILRLYPPAATVRMSPPGTNFQLNLPGGKQLCPDGTILYINSSIIQRDPAVWGDTADEFVPERWLGDTSAIPTSAWRPFERGPRACAGQELANIEAKVILALVARSYDFIKIGQGELDLDSEGQPVLDDKGYYKTKSKLFNSIQITAKPVDGTMMKVKHSERAVRI